MDTSNTQQPVAPNQGEPLTKKQQRRLEKQQAKQARQSVQTAKRSGSRIVFWLIILAILGFFVYAIGRLAAGGSDVPAIQTDIAIAATDHVLGNPKASVQLIEYADFQCPGCAAFHPVIKQLVADYSEKLMYTYRHFPLPQHQHAKIMAQATEAAGKQGKFWEMHDLIYKNQKSWSSLISVDEVISTYATQLGLDAIKFEKDIESSEVKDTVTANYKGGVSYGVNSTPSFFVNGVKISLPSKLDEFKGVIDQAIANATATVPKTN